MFDVGGKIATCIVLTCLLYTATFKSLGILQQSGYHDKAFLRWLKRKDNLYFNRLFVWSVCSVFAGSLAAICVSPLGSEISLIAFAGTFFLFSFFYCVSDKKRALKVPVNVTKRLQRLAVAYVLVTAICIYLILWALGAIEVAVGNELYSVFAAVPLAFTPMLTPFLLVCANAITYPFEVKNNARYVARAKSVLKKSRAIRIGVTGSYGKTSVKNILASVLSAKYSVIATPESYNTPAGVAKTVNCLNVEDVDVFIAEMGARRVGDVTELCELVEPDYAIFTGVCRQHIETFGSEENLLKAKCEIIKGAKKTVVCGAELREKISACESLTENERGRCAFFDKSSVSNLVLGAKGTSFTLSLGGEKLDVTTSLLGESCVENISLAVTLARELGMTKEEIERGLERVKPIPHRLQLIESNGVNILDDAYNCSERSAKEALAALNRFGGKKIVVTPGIVEGGVLEEKINGELGEALAAAKFNKVILVGETLVQVVKKAYLAAGGDEEKIVAYPTLERVKDFLETELVEGDSVLFMNDLPDVY